MARPRTTNSIKVPPPPRVFSRERLRNIDSALALKQLKIHFFYWNERKLNAWQSLKNRKSTIHCLYCSLSHLKNYREEIGQWGVRSLGQKKPLFTWEQ